MCRFPGALGRVPPLIRVLTLVFTLASCMLKRNNDVSEIVSAPNVSRAHRNEMRYMHFDVAVYALLSCMSHRGIGVAAKIPVQMVKRALCPKLGRQATRIQQV